MDYKKSELPLPTSELINDSDMPYCDVSSLIPNETTISAIESSPTDYFTFIELLESLSNTEKVNNDLHTKSILEKFNLFIQKNYKRINELNIFFKYKTFTLLLTYTYYSYDNKLRKYAYICLSTIVAAFPNSILYLINNGYLTSIDYILNKWELYENKPFLPPIFNGIGNLLYHMKKSQNEEIIKSLQVFINIRHLVNIANAKMEPKCFKQVMFLINQLYTQPYFSIEKDLFPLFLEMAQRVILSTISKEICLDKAHLRALEIIYLFCSDKNIPNEYKKENIMKLSIHECLNRYFDVQDIYQEKVMVSRIIALFYYLDIPDTYCIILKIVIMLELPPETGTTDDICESLKEIIETEKDGLLDFLYEHNFLNILISLINSGIFDYVVKSTLINLIATCVVFHGNSSIPDIYFTQGCFDIFLNLLDDDSNEYAERIIRALSILYETGNNRGIIDILNEIMRLCDGVSIIDHYTLHQNEKVAAMAILIRSFIPELQFT
ncbi:hypothetical protein TRFO_39371 [Tritrichomonas foetus]|uniref:Uncharacterized protein n=1 Tax=Tritrichomonas foetus TaxID=1144522 RepID=A0A1J4J565_9EUKA|nr:hypothetical protein TRFO_39371 [Tritrichomonas foetus]|eukprot:OHS94424.1 hypothetical protein TRFO_39371 [Tritrichomonas foetus]